MDSKSSAGVAGTGKVNRNFENGNENGKVMNVGLAGTGKVNGNFENGNEDAKVTNVIPGGKSPSIFIPKRCLIEDCGGCCWMKYRDERSYWCRFTFAHHGIENEA